MQYLMEHYDQILTFLVSLVGVASAVAAAIRAFAKVTPNDADDKFASRAVRFVGKLQKLLDRLAMNPKSDQARRK